MTVEELARKAGVPACNIDREWFALTEAVNSSSPDTTRCIKCGRSIAPDDSGAHRKFINRGASMFFCLACLGAYMDVSEAFLREKIEYFRQSGCTLFKMAN